MSVSKPRQIFVLREERSSWPGGQPARAVWLAQMWFANRDGVSGSWLTPWLCYRLPLGFCPWHRDTSAVSEHQVLWAFSGTYYFIASSSRIRCGQMGDVPASPSWPTSVFIPSQQPQRGIGSISRFGSRSRPRAPPLVLGWGRCDALGSRCACLAHSLQREKHLPHAELAQA